MADKTTHFGFEQVDWEEKQHRVAGVFDSVADNYDLMNDVMSFGVHRLWKRFAVEQTGARPGQSILDLAGGTGDLAARLSRLVGPEGEVIVGDINASMLRGESACWIVVLPVMSGSCRPTPRNCLFLTTVSTASLLPSV
jgi:demethylmenaquinone methyltransferase/2-methoxy-6-polyprenyl-1,4-benzoquinol methylase